LEKKKEEKETLIRSLIILRGTNSFLTPMKKLEISPEKKEKSFGKKIQKIRPLKIKGQNLPQ